MTLSPSMMKTGFPGKLVHGAMTMGNGNPAGCNRDAGIDIRRRAGFGAVAVSCGASNARKKGESNVPAAFFGACTTQGRTKSCATLVTLSKRSSPKVRIP